MRFLSLFSDPKGFLLGVLYLLPAILIGLSFHEWGHAYAAYRLGDPTARNLGRMTVNPLAHFDVFGFLMLILVGFGWAKPVPINPRNFKNPRRDELVVSFAGVVMNLLLAFVFMGIYMAVAMFVTFKNAALGQTVLTILYYIVVINIALFVFNLMPIPPLDGYRVVKCLFVRNMTGYKVCAFLERYGFLILILLLMSGALTSVLTVVRSWLIEGMSNVYSALFSLF